MFKELEEEQWGRRTRNEAAEGGMWTDHSEPVGRGTMGREVTGRS